MRPIMLRLSSLEILSFAFLYLILFLVTSNWFLLGGGTACMSLAINHRRLGLNYNAAIETPRDTARQ